MFWISAHLWLLNEAFLSVLVEWSVWTVLVIWRSFWCPISHDVVKTEMLSGSLSVQTHLLPIKPLWAAEKPARKFCPGDSEVCRECTNPAIHGKRTGRINRAMHHSCGNQRCVADCIYWLIDCIDCLNWWKVQRQQTQRIMKNKEKNKKENMIVMDQFYICLSRLLIYVCTLA